jgi:hypothetical protein
MLRLGTLLSDEGKVRLMPCHSMIQAHFLNGQCRDSNNGLRSKPKIQDKIALKSGESGEWYILGVISKNSLTDCIQIHPQCKIHDNQLTMGSSSTHLRINEQSLSWTQDGKEVFGELAKVLQSLIESSSQIVATCLGPGSLNPGVLQKAQAMLELLKKINP